MKLNLADRTPREKMILTAGVTVGVPLLVWLLVWNPLLSARQEALTKLESRRQTLEWMRGAASEIQSLRGTGKIAARSVTGSPEQMITSAARQQKLVINRIEPSGENRYNLWLAEADYQGAIRFLDSLHKQGVAVDSLNMARQAVPGRVSLRLTVSVLQ